MVLFKLNIVGVRAKGGGAEIGRRGEGDTTAIHKRYIRFTVPLKNLSEILILNISKQIVLIYNYLQQHIVFLHWGE